MIAVVLEQGVLTDFAALDVDAHHRRPKARADDVFTVIFLPTAAR